MAGDDRRPRAEDRPAAPGLPGPPRPRLRPDRGPRLSRGYRLTVRHGPRVERERFETLEEALAALEARAEAIRAEPGLPEVDLRVRRFEASDRVAARLEIAGPGRLRGPDAGLDVKGDGSLLAYRNAIFKRPLEPRGRQSVYEAIRDALAE